MIIKKDEHSTAGHPDMGKILSNGIETQNATSLVAARERMGQGLGDEESNISRNANRKLSFPACVMKTVRFVLNHF